MLGDPELPHLFFVEGGALAVENALKCAFDWKSRRNEAAGRSPELGTRVLHLQHAFHGRSGYTLSLTNTDPVKVDRFPKFDWPRVSSPAVRFPLDAFRGEVEAAERTALAEAEAAFEAFPHDIACFIAEPIQCEGGDRHLRAEFLLAAQELCHRNDALFVLDEVQTGAGTTGTPWCYQQLELAPDVVAFGKKVQLGGIMAGRRVLEVEENVLRTPGRISSTWGGNLTDMVRSRRLLQLVERTGAIANAATVGQHLLARLEELAENRPDVVSNARGRGFIAAIDLATSELRDEALAALRHSEHVLALACGERSLRFRPALSMPAEDVDLGCGRAEPGRRPSGCNVTDQLSESVTDQLSESVSDHVSEVGRPGTRQCSSIVGGRVTGDESGGRFTSTNPARLSDVVAEVALGDPRTFVEAARAARQAQAGWSRVPPRSAAGSSPDRPPGGGEQGAARPAREPRGRQTLRRVAGRGAGDHRHVRFLPR